MLIAKFTAFSFHSKLPNTLPTRRQWGKKLLLAGILKRKATTILVSAIFSSEVVTSELRRK